LYPSSTMSTSEAAASTVVPPHEDHVFSPEDRAISITPESIPAALKPQPTLTADAPSTNSEHYSAELAASSSPFRTTMTTSQDPDTPALPERPTSPPREPTPTVNQVPTASPDQPPEDPQLASLQAIFPDFDGAVLQSVLESVGGNQDRAIDMLLGMSDPDYVPQEPPAPVQSQTDLDEEFARRLMLEEQAQQQIQPQNWDRRGRRHDGTVYQPQASGRYSQPQGGADSQGGQKDSMAEFQEQFSKIADTGKKTFSSLVTKVKAKIQEFDQQRTGQSYTQGGTQPSWGSEVTGEQSQQHYQQQQQQAQPSYHDPNPPPRESRPVQGYDVTYSRNLAPSATAASMMPPVNATVPAVGNSSSPPISAPVAEPPRPTSTSTTSSPPYIDPGKLGMLPKRPVSLLRNPSEPALRPDDDDDDELEYVENPFEEHK